MSNKPKNISLRAAEAQLLKIMRPGLHFYQKWTCAKCGERVTGNTPDLLFEQGLHEDCGYITDLRETGCGYSVMASGKAAFDYLDLISTRKKHG